MRWWSVGEVMGRLGARGGLGRLGALRKTGEDRAEWGDQEKAGETGED